VSDGYLSHLETRQVIEWFDLGGSLQLGDTMSSKEVLSHARDVQGLIELAHAAGVAKEASPQLLASGVDFVLEGLYAQRKISRSDEGQFQAAEQVKRAPRMASDPLADREIPNVGSKKKYYN
jgi:magnesium chelatase subunit I